MNTTTAPTATTRRVLTQKESFDLLTWYTQHQERLLQVTDEGIVSEAGEALNIPGLNRAHLVSARKSLGIQKREQRKPAPPSGDLAALEGLVNEQAEQIVRLTTITQNLLDRVRRLESAGR